MKNIILLAVGLVFTLDLSAQQRVIWVHGLNNDNTFWRTQDNNFPGRTINRRSYSTDEGVAAMAEEIEDNSEPNERGIMIGHSMGGVAIRHIDSTNPDHFGGAVTFGAPLDGAPIIAELRNGRANRVLTDADALLNKGPDMAEDYSWFSFLLDLFSNPFSAKPWERAIVKGLTADLMTQSVGGAIDDFGNVSTSLDSDDLMVGSAYMNEIRDFASDKPKVVVWGNENEGDVHVRLASSAESNGANDTEFSSDYDRAKSAYKSSADSWKPAKICLINCNKKRNISSAFSEGYNYLNTGFEKDWEILTEAYRVVTTTYTEWVNICAEECEENIACFSDVARTSQLTRLPIFDDCWVQQTRTIRSVVREEYDGLLPRSTQVGARSAWTNQNTTIVEAEGVNHEEMGEHQVTESILREIFNGQRGGFFNGN